MSLNYFVNISQPQTFVNMLNGPVRYAIRIHWQLQLYDVNRKELVIPYNQSYESHTEDHIEIDAMRPPEELIADGRSENHPSSGYFQFAIKPGEDYYLWVGHFVNGVATYHKMHKFTAAVRR